MNIKHIIEKFLFEKCTQEELNFLNQYLESNDTKDLDEMIKADWNNKMYSKNSKPNEDKIWLAIKTKVSHLEKKKAKLNYKSYLKYAAVFLGMIFLSGIYFQFFSLSEEKNQNNVTIELDSGKKIILNSDSNNPITNNEGNVIANKTKIKIAYNNINEKLKDNKTEKLVYNTLNVPYGKTFQVVLSDGSEVYLNAGSSLKYPVKFIEGTERNVFLNGEAYFKVSKNKNDAFIVNTNKIQTKVYGTEFNITSYNNEDVINVVLVEGSVGVNNTKIQNSELKLQPNQLANYSKLKNTLDINNVDISGHIAWIDGVLLFKNEKFENIIRKLERHYDVKIKNNYNTLNIQNFTGRFETETIEEVLQTFKKTINFNYIKTNNQIIINP